MTDRPHSLRLRSSDNRRLAAALIGQQAVFGVDLQDGDLTVRCSDLSAFAQAVPRLARDAGISLFELYPTDESLESVFSYLVPR
jgi:ABC-2 type transport system ATP-binding protein